jgi:hypothetical protein
VENKFKISGEGLKSDGTDGTDGTRLFPNPQEALNI